MGIVALVSHSEVMFQSDKMGTASDKSLNFDEFMEVVLQLRGGNPATVRDFSFVHKLIHAQDTGTHQNFSNLQQQMEANRRQVKEHTKVMNTTQSTVKDLSDKIELICRSLRIYKP